MRKVLVSGMSLNEIQSETAELRESRAFLIEEGPIFL